MLDPAQPSFLGQLETGLGRFLTLPINGLDSNLQLYTEELSMSTRLSSMLMESVYLGHLDYPTQYGPANLPSRTLSYHAGDTS